MERIKIAFSLLENKNYKVKKVALVAVMRKLLVVACAILNSKRTYEENHVSCFKKKTAKIA